MSIKEGDGPQDQPAESLESLAAMLGGESEETSEQAEDSDESEQVEAAEGEGENAEAEGDEEPQDEDNETFTIKVDGKEITLSKAEVIARAQRDTDYTQKTMAVAKEREAVAEQQQKAEALFKQRQQAFDETLSRLDAVTRFAEAELGDEPVFDPSRSNPSDFIALQQAHSRRKDKLKQLHAAQQTLREQRDHERATALHTEAAETERHLVDTLPGWKDAPEKHMSAAHAVLEAHGLTPEAVPDAYVKRGLWELAEKARKWDELQTQKAKLKPEAKVVKVQKPGTTTNQPPQLAAYAAKVKAHQANPSLQTLANLL